MNLFPCHVTLPDGSVAQTCRVVSGADGTTVWAWDYALGDATAILRSPWPLEQNASGSRNYTLPLDDGTSAAVTRSTSCGCGHPMKRWVLPKPVRESTAG